MLGLGWRGEVVEGGLEGEANRHEGEATCSSRNNCYVVGDAVSAKSAAFKLDVTKPLPGSHAIGADAVVVFAALVQ